MPEFRISNPPAVNITKFDMKTVPNPNAEPTLPKSSGTSMCMVLPVVLRSPVDSAIRPGGVNTYISDIAMG